MKRVFQICPLLFLLSALWTNDTLAQTNVKHPSKYNKEFSGIGPQVYILPPPKTKEEILQDQYSTKRIEQVTLIQLIDKLELSDRLKRINNESLPIGLIDSAHMDREAQIKSAISYYEQANQHDSVLAWQNNLGTFKLLNGDLDEARDLFIGSLNTYKLHNDISNQQIVLQNLAILEEQSGNFLTSLGYYDELLDLAKKTKNIQREGLLNLSIALLQAKLGNYSAAHNLILKKSFPLLQKAKYFPDVVNALNTLATIKESEEKFTEAKWIYLQAIDVATIYKDEKGLAQSLFNVARLKTRIGDSILAIPDYKLAKDLAIKYSMNALLVEIEDSLGDVYLDSGNYTEAALALSSYNILKSEFINKQILL